MMPTVWSSPSSKDVLHHQKGIVTFVLVIFSGMAIIEIASWCKLGWDIVKGRRACRYSLLVLFLCIYLGLFSIVCTLAFVMRFYAMHFDAAILYTAQTTQRISHCAAYMILTTRAVAVCRSDMANWLLGSTHLVLWAILLLSLQTYSPYCMIIKPGPRNVCTSTIKATRLMTSVPFLVISIVFSTAVLWGYINERRSHGHNPKLNMLSFFSRSYRFCEKLCDEGFHYFVILIAVQVPLLVVDASRIDESGLLRFLMGNVAYITTVMCASRMFRLLVFRSEKCPIQNHCMFYRLFKDYSASKHKPEIPLEAVAHHGGYPRSGSVCPVGRTAAAARTPL